MNATFYQDSNSVPTVLPSTSTFSQAEAINELGQIVGMDSQAVFWNNSTSAETYLSAYNATDINDSGQIVGYDPYVPVFWNNSTSPRIQLNGNMAAATINNIGGIVGTNITGGSVYAIYWNNNGSSPTTLPNLSGATMSQGHGNNDAGQIVGNAILPTGIPNPYGTGTWVPVFWNNSSSQPMALDNLGGTFGYATRINDVGQIVGSSNTASGVEHAVLWNTSNSAAIDLNSVLPSGTGWELQLASDVNNFGVIIGRGTLNGDTHGFALIDIEHQAYPFQGFFSPVDNLPLLNSVKAGQAIPIKFSIGGYYGLNIFAGGYPKSQKVECSSTAVVDGIEETVTAGSSSLSYSSGNQQYIYVWKTDNSWANSCRQFVLKLIDNSVHRAVFKFK